MIRSTLNSAYTVFSLAKYKSHIWLPNYIRRRWTLESVPEGVQRHAIITVVDHFEPSRSLGEAGVARVKDWCAQYLAATCDLMDDDGRSPQHTWFYRFDYPNFDCLRLVSEAVFRGAGEIEFHLHHGNDTSENFARTLTQGKAWFGSAGAMLTQKTGDCRFAYIAGNWALANGQGDDRKSGVDDEIALLRDAGCYADFTFPAFGERSQPSMVNTIYYATQSSNAKCYNTGEEVCVGGKEGGDLLLFQGPLYIDPPRRVLDYAAVENYAPYYEGRVENWLKAAVSVRGRPEWTFIKLHTHGMQSAAVVTGSAARYMYMDILERLRSQGIGVHFATAREAYNIVKAAESGCAGNPGDYRDYLIPPPMNRRLYCSQPCELSAKGSVLAARLLKSSPGSLSIRFSGSGVESVDGEYVSSVELDAVSTGSGLLSVLGHDAATIRTRNREDSIVEQQYHLPLRARVIAESKGVRIDPILP